MHFIRSTVLLSSLLAHVSVISAAVANSQELHIAQKRHAAAGADADIDHPAGPAFEKRQQICREDAWLQALQNITLASQICEVIIGPAIETDTVDYTPTVYAPSPFDHAKTLLTLEAGLLSMLSRLSTELQQKLSARQILW